jgi:hypothetical protein
MLRVKDLVNCLDAEAARETAVRSSALVRVRSDEAIARHPDMLRRQQVGLVFSCAECELQVEWLFSAGDVMWASDRFSGWGWSVDASGTVRCPTHTRSN